jgi:hypothetical protein
LGVGGGVGGVGGAVGGAVGGGVGTGGGVGPLVHAVPVQAKPQSHEQPEPSLNCAPGKVLEPQNALGEKDGQFVAQPTVVQSHTPAEDADAAPSAASARNFMVNGHPGRNEMDEWCMPGQLMKF